MKTLILTLAGALALSVTAYGFHIDESKEACRASMVEGKNLLVALPLLEMADEKAPIVASLTMDAADLPPAVRAMARPIYEARAYCEMAEVASK